MPPLDYPLVHRLKRERPGLNIEINGGIGSLEEAEAQLAHTDGVMLGRAAYHTPGILGQADRRIFGAGADVDPFEAVELYKPYIAPPAGPRRAPGRNHRHMLGLFHGAPGARTWRRILTVDSVKPGADLSVVDRALAAVSGLKDQRGAGGLEAGEAA